MKNVLEFSSELQDLIEENKKLKDYLKKIEELLKLSICVSGKLKFRTKENVDENTYKYFIENTHVVNFGNRLGGLSLMWSKDTSIEIDKRAINGFLDVNIQDIDTIFNGGKLKKIITNDKS